MMLLPVRARNGEIVAWTKVDEEDYEELARFTWRLHSRGYVCRAAATVLIHRQIMGVNDAGREVNVDHWNGDKLDNRRENLRISTVAQNGQNRRGVNGNNTTGYRGVKRARNGRWQARCWTGTREHSLGTYDTPEEAAQVAADWRRQNMPYSQEAAQLTGGMTNNGS